MGSTEADLCLRKAEKLLGWARQQHESMLVAGESADMAACDQAFHRVLSDVNAACEAMFDASKMKDEGRTRDRVLTQRQNDPLLFYFWKARDAVTHHVVDWNLAFQFVELEIVDPDKANQYPSIQEIMCAAFGVSGPARLVRALRAGRQPSAENLAAAGARLRVNREAIGLNRITYTDHRGRLVELPPPTTHLGYEIPNSADQGGSAVISFYERILADLRSI